MRKRHIVDIQTNPYMFAFLHFLLLSKFQVYPSLRFFWKNNSICLIYCFILSSSSYYQEQRANMETLNILIMCASVFWIIVFFLCLGPCLLSISKVATQWKEYTGKFQNRTQSAEYFKRLNHKRYSAPPQIIIRPPSWVRNMDSSPIDMESRKSFLLSFLWIERINKF